MAPEPATVDEYIAAFEPDVQARLRLIRSTLHGAVPGMTDGIHHIGMYPVPASAGEQAGLEDELAPLRSTKDTIKLMYRDPVPTALLGRLTRALVTERTTTD